jgi:hypothetical protein
VQSSLAATPKREITHTSGTELMRQKRVSSRRKHIDMRLVYSAAFGLFMLSVLALGVALLTLLSPSGVAGLNWPPARPTLVSVGGALADLLATPTRTPGPPPLPPTWTPSPALTPPTVTPSRTPTITNTPSPSPTPIPTITPTPLPTMRPGWHEYTSPKGGFTFQLPATWVSLGLSGRDVGATLAQIRAQDALLADGIAHGLGNAVLDNVYFIAFDSATQLDTFATSINVWEATQAEGQNADEVALHRWGEYHSSEFYTLEAAEKITVDWIEADHLYFTSTFTDLDVEIVVYQQEVIVGNRRGEVLIFTFSTSQERLETYAPLFERVIETIRLPR